ncbi:F-box protein FBW2-like [Bidens hawaiensis]|uniref:F-box protein FBW2-like n=1 Tax=Bidens hawaiensis TaxID=980011 RepID=UPI00404A1FE5
MSKNTMTVVPPDESTLVPVTERWRPWDALNPEILGLIFVRIPIEEMTKRMPFVCKGWLDTVMGPYCWSEIDLEAWCRRRNDSHTVDQVMKKLIRRSKFRVQRLSTYLMGETGFFFTAHCGSFLKVLEMPMTDITDQMVLKHMKPLPKLTVLDISHCVKITSKGIAAFSQQCKSLIQLKRNLPAFDVELPVDDSEAKAIAETMPNLQRIEVCLGRFGDSGVNEILTKCKAVTHLDINGSWNVKLSGELGKICDRLECFMNPWIDNDDRFSDISECGDADIADSD